jgi:hypothetical protein
LGFHRATLMSEKFDPYHKWLGIPLKDQPPNHYRLLGICDFEDDPDVIDHAADQRMTHVRSVPSRDKLEVAQKILNKIASARVCLLNPADKEAYDRQLRRQVVVPQAPPAMLPVAQPVPAVPLAEEAASDAMPELASTPVPKATRRQGIPTWQIAAALGIVGTAVVLSVALVIWGIFVARNRELAQTIFEEDNGQTQLRPVPREPDPPSGSARPDSEADDEGASLSPAGRTDSSAASSPSEGNSDPGNGRPEAPPGGKSPDDSSVATEDQEQPSNRGSVAGEDSHTQDASASSSGQQSARIPIPAAAAQQQSLTQFAAVLADKSASQILAIAQSEELVPAARFAFFVRAKETAASAGEVSVALHVVDKMAAEYEVDPMELKTETLSGLSETSEWPTALGDVSRACLSLVDEAMARGNRQLAHQLAEVALSAARRAEDADLAKIATYRLLRLREP